VNKKSIGSRAAVMVIIAMIGLTMFTENVRNVQILGLFASGAVFGVALGKLIDLMRAGRKQEDGNTAGRLQSQ
jgi:hypothetical protein